MIWDTANAQARKALLTRAHYFSERRAHSTFPRCHLRWWNCLFFLISYVCITGSNLIGSVGLFCPLFLSLPQVLEYIMESVMIFVGMRLRTRQDSRGCLCTELQRRYKCYRHGKFHKKWFTCRTRGFWWLFSRPTAYINSGLLVLLGSKRFVVLLLNGKMAHLLVLSSLW